MLGVGAFVKLFYVVYKLLSVGESAVVNEICGVGVCNECRPSQTPNLR